MSKVYTYEFFQEYSTKTSRLRNRLPNDTLKIMGNIKDSYNRNTDEFITAMLYPIDSLYNDSIIYNGKPLYVSNTLDSTNFKFTNLIRSSYFWYFMNYFVRSINCVIYKCEIPFHFTFIKYIYIFS